MQKPESPTHTSTTLTARILKAMSIFGSVQVLALLCSVVRTKLVALWIGPAGVGIITLYNSTMEMLYTTGQLNLRQSAVRDISAAAAQPAAAARIIAVLRRLMSFLGVAGMLAVIALSPLLSRWTFGDATHTGAFTFLSVMMFCMSVSAGEYAVMQGLDRLRTLARCNLYSSVSASLAAIPLFYFFREDAIVPAVALFSITNYIFARAARRGLTPGLPTAPHIRLTTALREGRGMISLGFYMTVSSFVSLLASYIFAVYLRSTASEAAVGIYQAGFVIINAYFGIIFNAISMEYFPRLSTSVGRRRHAGIIVSHEMRVVLAVLMPIVVIFICADDLIVHILYSDEFDGATAYMSTAVLGVLLRASSWCLSYVMLAKGDGRIFVLTETVSAAVFLALSIAGYRYGGNAGLGCAYAGWYAVYMAIVWIVYRRRYAMRLARGLSALLAAALAVGAAALWLRHCAGPWITMALTLPWLLPLSWKLIRGKYSRKGRRGKC